MSASQSPSPVPLDTLLTHREWVRRLARSLVRDDASADDVAQRTWLAVLHHPPYDAATARAWLARVVRNDAFNAHRTARRRGAHEQAAARPETARSAADIVAEAEIHNRLVAAVLALEEPYRSTVVLRWFEDLPPRDVASRMDVPVETVRTRLRRAHEALQVKLGGREQCAVLLAPMAGLRVAASAAKTSGLVGGSIMGTKVAYTVAAVAVAFGGGMLVRDVASSEAPSKDRSPEVAALQKRIDSMEAAQKAAERHAASPSDRSDRAERIAASLEEKVAAQQIRIDALEKALADADGQTASGVRTAAARALASGTTAAPDAERLRAMSDADLLAWIKAQTGSGSRGGTIDGRAVVDACDILLARQLDVPKRAEGLTQKGIGYRVLDDRPSEEAAFREALNVAGAHSPEGRQANYQLAWTSARHGEKRAAAEKFHSLYEDTDAPPKQRAWNRLYAAQNFESAGDKDRASTEYRGVVDEYGASEDGNARAAADQAKKALDRAAQPQSPR